MLALPPEWQSFTGGAIASHLFGQLSENTLQQEIARHLIGACMDILAAGISLRKQTAVVVRETPNLSWQIGDTVFVYLQNMNNKSLSRAIELSSGSFFGSIIVPPGCDEIFRRACYRSWKKKSRPFFPSIHSSTFGRFFRWLTISGRTSSFSGYTPTL